MRGIKSSPIRSVVTAGHPARAPSHTDGLAQSAAAASSAVSRPRGDRGRSSSAAASLRVSLSAAATSAVTQAGAERANAKTGTGDAMSARMREWRRAAEELLGLGVDVAVLDCNCGAGATCAAAASLVFRGCSLPPPLAVADSATDSRGSVALSTAAATTGSASTASATVEMRCLGEVDEPSPPPSPNASARRNRSLTVTTVATAAPRLWPTHTMGQCLYLPSATSLRYITTAARPVTSAPYRADMLASTSAARAVAVAASIAGARCRAWGW